MQRTKSQERRIVVKHNYLTRDDLGRDVGRDFPCYVISFNLLDTREEKTHFTAEYGLCFNGDAIFLACINLIEDPMESVYPPSLAGTIYLVSG